MISHFTSNDGPEKRCPSYVISAQDVDYLFTNGLHLVAHAFPLSRDWEVMAFDPFWSGLFQALFGIQEAVLELI